MDTYLTEVKQLRIPRPKFEPSGSLTGISAQLQLQQQQQQHHQHQHQHHWRHFVRPFTPPRDYNLATNNMPAACVTVSEDLI